MLSHVLVCHHRGMIGGPGSQVAQLAEGALSRPARSSHWELERSTPLDAQVAHSLLLPPSTHRVRVCRFACWQHDTGIDINQFVELLHETLKPSDRTVLLHIVDNINWPRTEEFFRRKSEQHCPQSSFSALDAPVSALLAPSTPQLCFALDTSL